MLTAALACGPVARSLAAAPEQADLAERLLEMGEQLDQVSPDAAAALADAADRMLPADPRLLRQAVDLRLALGQREQAIRLLGQLRQLTPTDQLALVQSIDLLSAQSESAEQKADFLQKMIDNTNLAAEVRSHAAVLLAGVQSERGLDDGVDNAITTALRLNPVNARALQWRLDQQMRHGTAPLRAHALVESLLANPLQPPVLSRLAEEHARAGAVPEAAGLYGRLFDQLTALESPSSSADAINYVLMLLQAGRAKEVPEIAGALLKNDPFNAHVEFLNVLVAQQSGDAAAVTTAIATARGAFNRSLMGLQQRLDSNAPNPDGIANPPLPDVVGVAGKLKAAENPNLSRAFLQTLADLAWLDVYFLGQPAPQPVVDAIHTLSQVDGDSNNAVTARIDGFTALAAGKLDVASQTLSHVADRDVLSQLGMLIVRLKQGQDAAAVTSDGTKLLQQYPVDVISLMIRQSLRPAGKIEFRSADADAIVAESKRLPERWLDFARSAADNYLLSIEPVVANVALGDPVLVQVTLQNVGNRPLLIGPGGVIDQYVPLDITVRGLQQQAFPAAGFARLTASLVLRPGQSVTATTRVDNPAVAAYLATGPQYDAAMFVSGIVNAASHGGALVPGLGGVRRQANGVVDRAPINYAQQSVRDAVAALLAGTNAVDRARAVMQLSAAAAQLASAGDAASQQLAAGATAAMQKTADGDASPTVRAVARQQLALQQNDADQSKAVQAMLASADFETKLLGCLLTINRAAADRRAMLSPLGNDADPILQRLAAALAKLPDTTAAAATQPAK